MGSPFLVHWLAASSLLTAVVVLPAKARALPPRAWRREAQAVAAKGAGQPTAAAMAEEAPHAK